MNIYTVYADVGGYSGVEYTGIVAESAGHAERIVMKMTNGRAKNVKAVRKW